MGAQASRAIAWMLYFLIFLSFMIGLVMSYRDYKYYRSHREEMKVSNQLYTERNCVDLKAMAQMGVQSECHKRQHMLEQDPAEYAVYDVLKGWSLCGDQGCIGVTPNTDQVGIFTIRSVLELAMAMFFLVFVILLSIGLCLCNRFLMGWGANILPIHDTTKVKYM